MNGGLPYSGNAEVDEVVRVVVPPDIAPEIRIDNAGLDLGTVVFVERLQFRRQQVDRAPHDQLMRRKPPGKRLGGQ